MVPWKVETVSPLPGYRLEVTFADGFYDVVDLSDVPHAGAFEPWADPGYFEQTRVDPEIWTVCWPNGADVVPDAMYEEVKRQRGGGLGKLRKCSRLVVGVVAWTFEQISAHGIIFCQRNSSMHRY